MTQSNFDEARYPVGPAGNFQRPAFGLKWKIAEWMKKLMAAVERWSNRRAIYQLSRLDNRHLRDIGLTREDVTWALSLPYSVDPSDELNDLVQRRRDARYWARRRCAPQTERTGV